MEETSKPETIAQKALRLLTPIPTEDFISDNYTDEIGKCCGIGHYVRATSQDPSDYSVKNCSDSVHKSPIRIASRRFLEKKHNVQFKDLAEVNNYNTTNGYTESRTKDRVIHLLTDMVEAGY